MHIKLFQNNKFPILFSLLFLTPIRIIILPLIFFFPLLTSKFYHYKNTSTSILLIVLYIVASVLGVIRGSTDFANGVVALWIYIPLFILMFCKVTKDNKEIDVCKFIEVIRKILIVIDIVGFICRFIIYKTVDEFGIPYGRHFQYVSGLAMMNAFYIFYYFTKIIHNSKKYKKVDISYFLFFLSSFIFCFYGLGVLCLISAMAIFFMLKLNIKSVLYSIITLLIIFYSMKKFDSDVIDYNKQNINVVVDNNSGYSNARKVLMFINYYHFADEYPLDAFIGVGGGGYNSRVAFLLNNDSENIFTMLFGHHMPVFHVKYSYPLWNNSFVSYESYTDGTRNKPFSSLLAILAEGGVLVFLIFVGVWIKKIIYIYKKSKKSYLYTFLFILNIFWILSMASEVWFESSEFLFFIIMQNLILSIKFERNDTKNNSLLLAGTK